MSQSPDEPDVWRSHYGPHWQFTYKRLSVRMAMLVEQSIRVAMTADEPECWEALRDALEGCVESVEFQGETVTVGQIPDMIGLAVVHTHPSFRRRPLS